MNKFFVVIFLVFISPISHSGSWKEVSCDQISIKYLNTDFFPTYCSKIFDQGVHGSYMVLNNNNTGESIEIQHDYFIDNNAVWGNDWAHQSLKKDKIRSILESYELGRVEHIDSSSTKYKNGIYYKNYITSQGSGFYLSTQRHNHIWTLGYYNIDGEGSYDNSKIDYYYLPISLKGIKKGKSVISNQNHSAGSQNDNDFITFCKNSTISELSEDIALLCLEKLKK